MSGRREIPPTLEPLTVSVHVGEGEEIVGMATIEVEDIEGCVSPTIFSLIRQRVPNSQILSCNYTSLYAGQRQRIDVLLALRTVFTCNPKDIQNGFVVYNTFTMHLRLFICEHHDTPSRVSNSGPLPWSRHTIV